MSKFDDLYNELEGIAKELLVYYDVDKVKPYSVYIWTKGEHGENVFDIQADEIVFYVEDHVVIEETKPIIERIQLKLIEIERSI